MCTVSWRVHADGYELLFNRDESRLRKPATPPGRRRLDGIDVLTPADGDFGGTWITVNGLGWCVAVLNRYQDSTPGEGPFTSRGHLVLDLATCRDLGDVQQRLRRLTPQNYRPFTLVLTPPNLGQGKDSGPWQWIWNGREQRDLQPVSPPLASSGFAPETIQEARRDLFTAMSREQTSLLDFHRSHRPTRGPWSPCMHRPEASTVSLVRVTVDATRVTMAYADGPPCRTELSPPEVLPRRHGAVTAAPVGGGAAL